MNDNIKSDNKKALPKFLIIIACSALVGAVFGYLGAELLGEAARAADGFIAYLAKAAPVLLCFWSVAAMVAAVVPYLLAMREYKNMDPEQDDATKKTELYLSVSLLIEGIGLIGSFFFFAAAFAGRAADTMDRTGFLLAMGGMVLSLAAYIVVQMACVDLTRRMNPEKRGSVFDSDFRKKWMDSCDEAERMTIYCGAFSAYQAVTFTCLAVWLIALILGVSAGMNTLAAAGTAMLIWCVQTVVYSVRTMK